MGTEVLAGSRRRGRGGATAESAGGTPVAEQDVRRSGSGGRGACETGVRGRHWARGLVYDRGDARGLEGALQRATAGVAP